MKILAGILAVLTISLGGLSYSIAQSTDIDFDGDQNHMTSLRYQRRLWITNDGTYGLIIQRGEYGAPGESGLVLLRSIDYGLTWNFVAQIDPCASAFADGIIDNENTVRLVVSTIKEGASADFDVRFVLLNYDPVNRNWAQVRANMVFDATASKAGAAASIARDSSNRLWVAFRYYNSADYWIVLLYSKDDGITWENSTVSFGTKNSSFNKYGKVIAFNGNIGIVYHDFDGINNVKEWAYRNDQDSETGMWSASHIGTVSADEPRGCHFSVAVDDSGTVHLAYANHVYAIMYQKYDGAWGTPLTLYSGGSNYPNITTNGHDLWVVFMEHVNCLQNRIIYKQYMRATDSWDANVYYLSDSFERAFDAKVVPPPPYEIGKAIYLGLTEKFDYIAFDVSSEDAAGTVSYEYWNGGSWALLPILQKDNADFRKQGYGFVRFEKPDDWQTENSPDAFAAQYPVRMSITNSYAARPSFTSMTAIKNNRRPSAPERVGSLIPIVWQEGAMAPYNIKYNDFQVPW